MKRLRGIVIALFVVMAGLTVLTEWYARTQRDREPPTITCDSEILEVSVTAEEKDLLQGVTATDNRDGDITSRVAVEHFSNLLSGNRVKVTYVVFDSADNAATCSRTIQYTDYQSPRFQLSEPLHYFVGDTITLLDRLTAVDVMDGEIQEKIRMTASNLTNTLAGTYHVTLQVTNSLGDTSVLPLTILVDSGSKNTMPQITLSDYLIYLDTGADFDPEDYLQRITDPNASPRIVNKSKAEIFSDVDTQNPGAYEVVYSYTSGIKEAKTILTVVVV